MRLRELLLESRVQDLITKYGDKLVDKLSNENVSISDSRTAIQEFNKNNPSGKWVFTEWLIVNYLKNNIRYEDLYKAKNYIPLFIRYNTELDNRDILQYNTLQELYITVEPFMHKAVVKDTRKGKEVEQDTIDELEQKLFKTNQAKILYEDSTYKVVKINSYKASVYFGSGSQWCISNKDDKHYWEHYTSKEPNVTFVLMKNSNEKFAFLPKMDEFRDNADEMVDLYKFFNEHTKLIEILNPLEWLEYKDFSKRATYQLLQFIDSPYTFNRDVNLKFMNNLTKLPDNLTVNGSLDLEYCVGLTELPKNLTVNGVLHLSGNRKLTKLPDDLKVKILVIGGTGIYKLPDNLTVEKISIINCENLKEIGNNITVNYNFMITPNDTLVKIGDNLTVKGVLDLRSNKALVSIGENLKVSRHIDLTNCNKLKKMPKKFYLNPDFINYFPSQIIYDEEHNKFYHISELPEGYTITNHLVFGYNHFVKLPKNLTVNGDLYIENSNMFELPDGLIINGDLTLKDPMLFELFGNNITVNGTMLLDINTLDGEKIQLPKDIKVKDKIKITKNSDIIVPENLNIEWLDK